PVAPRPRLNARRLRTCRARRFSSLGGRRNGVTRARPRRPEVDRSVAASLQGLDELLLVVDVAIELGRAHADEAHQVRVAPAEAEVAVVPHEVLDALVL